MTQHVWPAHSGACDGKGPKAWGVHIAMATLLNTSFMHNSTSVLTPALSQVGEYH